MFGESSYYIILLPMVEYTHGTHINIYVKYNIRYIIPTYIDNYMAINLTRNYFST